MQLKCPACSTLLNVPDSAAGKLVSCPCGTQLKVPGGSPAAAQPTASPKPAAPKPAARRPQTRQPAPQPTAPQPTAPQPTRSVADSGGFGSASAFDDLTDTDLQPVRGVTRPGQEEVKSGPSEGDILRKFAESGDSEDKDPNARPSGLKTVAAFCFIGVVYSVLQLVSLFQLIEFIPVPPEWQFFASKLIAMTCVLYGADITINLFAGVASLTRFKAAWYFLLFTFGYTVITRVTEIVDCYRFTVEAMDWAVAIFRFVIICGFVFYLHSKEVRKFYDTLKSPWWKTSLMDLLGAGLSGGLVIAYILVTKDVMEDVVAGLANGP